MTSSNLPADVLTFLSPERLWRRNEVLSLPSPIPAAPGVYGWWFNRLPGSVDVSGCHHVDGFTLLYTGIDPKQPPRNRRQRAKDNSASGS